MPMTSARPHRTLVVLNPHSRNGQTGRRWSKIETLLREALGPFEVVTTHEKRDLERIAIESVRSGVDRLVVAGGDGTLNQVVTGLLSAELAGDAQLGLLPLGTGGDFTRVSGGSRSLAAAIRGLAAGATRTIDAGRITYRSHATDSAESRQVTGYFANVASLGLSGLVDELVNQSTKAMGGRASFLIGTLRGLAQYRSQQVAITIDGEKFFEGRLVLAAAANGRYFGGGMHVAPDAKIDDGQLDLVVVPHLTTAQLLSRLPSLYRGTHVRDPRATRVARGSVIEADAEPGTVLLDIDGEQLGTLPARFEILPRAITLFGVGRE